MKIVSQPKHSQFHNVTTVKNQFQINLSWQPKSTWFYDWNAPLNLIMLPKMAQLWSTLVSNLWGLETNSFTSYHKINGLIRNVFKNHIMSHAIETENPKLAHSSETVRPNEFKISKNCLLTKHTVWFLKMRRRQQILMPADFTVCPRTANRPELPLFALRRYWYGK